MASDLSSIFVIIAFAISLVNVAPMSMVLARKPCQFPAIFNFGDSNSDTGGLSAAFGQAPPPNGLSYFGGPAGRYCDGRLVIDFIAESLGLPYLSGFSPISLNVQYYEFHDFVVRSQVVRGVSETLMPKEEDFSSALYTFDIGQNDLTAGYFLNMSKDEVKAYVPDDIYNEGGRYFWIHNTGPVGCLPYVMERIAVLAGQIDEYGCASPFNEVAQFFNEDLVDAAITYVDVYSVKFSLISQGRKHGEPFMKQLQCHENT
ncbi:hypothetical protein CXB51_008388 [Gossypium anomalum]|uniref:Alpha-L-fucosidase n=1 Tax=Gossypium anomalum TaxID=47600 RepID=A0A8J6D6T0_9ROSI|nr:hypothetical protein CXB51_008388 [Gossypium anomalum]